MGRILTFLIVLPLWAQDPLSLREAVALALRGNQGVTAASESAQAAAARVEQARSGRLPKMNYSESFTRSDNPVFVFGSLLTQHQFGEQNFAIGTLNRPEFLNNFQSQLTVDQPLYDGRQTRHAVESAEWGRKLSAEDTRRVEMEVIAGAARAYCDLVLAGASLQAAEQAMRSAEADLKRAEFVRAAGMSTDVDVLSIRVHLAGVSEQRIRRAADLDVARAALNDAMGAPLDTRYSLTTALTRAEASEQSLEALEREAGAERPEARQTRLATNLAQTQVDAAHAAFLPQVGLHAAFEADRRRFVNRGGSNWLAAVSLHWNLFNGFTDKARVIEAGHVLRGAEANVERTKSAVHLQVRRTFADLQAAEQRIEVARAAVEEAAESLRITQNRYEAGMSNVTDPVRTESAVLEGRTRYLAAIHDQRVAATMLEFAAGRLTARSEVLN